MEEKSQDIDIDQLLAVCDIVAASIPGEPLYGHVAQAGVTKGYVSAAGRA